MINAQALQLWRGQPVHQQLTPHTAKLYALSVGVGADATDPRQLAFASGPSPRVLPSMVSLLCQDYGWLHDPRTGVGLEGIVHVEEDIDVQGQIAAFETMSGLTQVQRVVDRGFGRGALIEHRRDITDGAGRALARVRQRVLARDAGGFELGQTMAETIGTQLPAVPATPADLDISVETLPQQALFHALCGDENPLHWCPKSARQAGFDRPILHGLCTLGIATYIVLRECCCYETHRLRRIAARFTAPVLPGEILGFELWHGPDGGVHLRARAILRHTVVLDRGWFELR